MNGSFRRRRSGYTQSARLAKASSRFRFWLFVRRLQRCVSTPMSNVYQSFTSLWLDFLEHFPKERLNLFFCLIRSSGSVIVTDNKDSVVNKMKVHEKSPAGEECQMSSAVTASVLFTSTRVCLLSTCFPACLIVSSSSSSSSSLYITIYII